MKQLTAFFAVLFLLTAFTLSGQSYNTTFGMRFGTDWGITAKQRVAKKTSVEFIAQASLQREEMVLTVLGEQHLPMPTRRLNVYTGAGFHKGWINEPVDAEQEPYRDPFGLSFIMGIELTLLKMNLSYDFKPAINLIGGEQRIYMQTGISARYVIAKRKRLPWEKKKKKFNWKFWQKKK